MSGDFDDDDDGFNPFAADDAAAADSRPIGLLVPATGRQIFNSKRELVWDEISELLEPAFRRQGRPLINFEEGDDHAE